MIGGEPATPAGQTATPAGGETVTPADREPLDWRELRAQATLGTARRPRPVTGTIAGVRLPDEGLAEQSVLAAAAAMGAARRVSTSPLRLGQLPGDATAPADPLPVAPARAGQLLDIVLAGEVVTPADATPLLQQWLERCAATGHRVAAEVLPTLLTRIVGSGVDRVVTAEAVGQRGRWLAAQQPMWAPVADVLLDADNKVLQDRLQQKAAVAGRPSRPAALAALRRRDRDAAAAALVMLWPTAGTPERRAIIDGAADDLGTDDEPWLEAALADRAPQVSRAAAALLARLPDSPRSRRMAARLDAMAEVSRPRLRRQLHLQRPTSPSPEDLRDASSDPPAGGDVADWWQAEILRGAPLPSWSGMAGGVQPALRLLGDHAALLHLISHATVAQRDPDWQLPVLHALLDGVGLGAADLARLSGAAAQAAERTMRLARTAAVAELAASLPMPWSHETGAALLRWALGHPTPGPVLATLRPALAAGLATDMVDVVRDHEGYRGADARQVGLVLQRLRHVLSLRVEIDAAFAASSDSATNSSPPARADHTQDSST